MIQGRYMCWVLLLICSLAKAQSTQTEAIQLQPEEFYIQYNKAIEPVLLDLRQWSDYRRQRIPGSRLAESSSQLYAITDSIYPQQNIFIYCFDMQRSKTVVQLLKQKGFDNIFILQGGWIEWKKSGLPIDTKYLRRKLMPKIQPY